MQLQNHQSIVMNNRTSWWSGYVDLTFCDITSEGLPFKWGTVSRVGYCSQTGQAKTTCSKICCDKYHLLNLAKYFHKKGQQALRYKLSVDVGLYLLCRLKWNLIINSLTCAFITTNKYFHEVYHSTYLHLSFSFSPRSHPMCFFF